MKITSLPYAKRLLAFLLMSNGLMNFIMICKHRRERVTLTNPVLRFIDGVPFGIDATAVKNCLFIRKEILAIQYGDFNKSTNTHVGRYLFEGQKYSLEGLMDIEEALVQEYEHRKGDLDKRYVDTTLFRQAWALHEELLQEELERELHEQETLAHNRSVAVDEHEETGHAAKVISRSRLEFKYEEQKERDYEKIRSKYVNNPTEYDKALQKINAEHTKKMAPLNDLLENKIKPEIMKITLPHMEKARTAKKFLLPLMVEWSKKAGRPMSPLLRWHEDNSGSEKDMFKRDANSFKRVFIFCTDLVDFNESIIYSCPRAYNQFKELYSQHKK